MSLDFVRVRDGTVHVELKVVETGKGVVLSTPLDTSLR
jgi:hypothetical protein